MQALLYANLSTGILSEKINGAAFAWPTLIQGDDVRLALRFTRNIGSRESEVSRAVVGLKCTLGRVDARPLTGSFQIKVGDAAASPGVNVTSAIQHNQTADQLAAILNALSGGFAAGQSPVTVVADSGSWLVHSADGTQLDLSVNDNTLAPLSFVRIREFQFDGKWVSEIRLIQAPLAFAEDSARVVAPAPTVEEVQAGGSDETSAWNEIQKLIVPPAFRGRAVFQLRRGARKSAKLDGTDSAAGIQAAIAALADTGGTLIVTNPIADTAYIEFGGSMAGQSFDLLTVEILDAREGDLTFTLSLDTEELDAALRATAPGPGQDSPQLTLPFEIEITLEDENDSEVHHVFTFRSSVVVKSELTWEELTTPASIDWLKPPLPKDYVRRSADQITVGGQTVTQILGDGAATSFVVTHNLDARTLHVTVRENSAAGRLLSVAEDYTVDFDDDNALTITMVSPTPPGVGDLIAIVTLAGTRSVYEAHTHEIDEINGLETILDNHGNAIADLQSRLGISVLAEPVIGTTAPGVTWTLPKYAELFGIRGATAFDAALGISALDLGKLPRHGGGLLAALHKTSSTNLTVPLPAAGAGYVGTLYKNASGDTVLLPAGLKHRTQNLLDGEYAACDGRLWYKVARPAADEVFTGYAFTVNTGTDVLTVASGHGLANGSRVRVTTTGTLPGGLAASTDYFVRDLSGDTCKLAATSGGSAIDITSAGSGTHTVGLAPKSSYYPADFDRELFFLACNDAELRLGFMLELLFGFEVALIPGERDRPDADSKAQWVLVIEHGAFSDESDPARTGQNLAAITWSTTPLLSQRLMLTRTPVSRAFGCRIKRSLLDAITSQKIIFGAEAGGDSTPASANFALRARLTRFDTENSISAPRGFIALRGLDVGDGATSTDGLGKATIKPLLS